jgi:hypothetical protein
MNISEKTCEMVDQLIALQAEIDDRIREESGGIYGLCKGSELTLQLSATMAHSHDLAELEAFVGPIRERHAYDDGSKSYHFMLGKEALGIILMPVGTTDSRMTGGEADDVCVDQEA